MDQELKTEIFRPSLYKRDSYGLLENCTYIFNEDNSINWRAMIKPEFLYINREYFERFEKPIPSSIEGLTDKQLLIMIGGLKELAKLRGFKKVNYDVDFVKDGYVSAKCTILWNGNYETSFEDIEYQDVGNASIENTDSFCHKFLETMACNRAFVRCVRNFLNIHIVGFDEIDKSEKSSIAMDASAPNDIDSGDLSVIKPSALLKNAAELKGLASFEDFKKYLRSLWVSETYKNEDASKWNDFGDIPARECRKILVHLESFNAGQKSS
jgi:hypothetical protein